MKKNKCLKICLIVLFFTIFAINLKNNVNASTNTYPRSESDLQINSRITNITEQKKQAILKTPKVDETEKVYDFANLLSDTEEVMLQESIKKFIDSYDLDMAIVTISTNNKRSTQVYADDFYDYNYFGKNDTCDGLLFLIDMANRQIYISTTGKAQLVYDDARINSILDDTYNYISKGKYYDCASAFISSSAKYAKLGVPSSNKNANIDSSGNYYVDTTTKTKGKIHFVVILIVSGVITFLIVLSLCAKHKVVRKATSAKTYMVVDSFSLSSKIDKFLTTNTVSRYIPPANDYGSGGGGSSTHSGSSGISHGGGGRSF